MAVTITVDTRPPIRLAGELERQLPFAVSLGMNNALKQAQLAVVRNVLSTFVIRRQKYLTESVKITKFSTKQDLTATLEIDPTRNVLAKFEPGGLKEARGGGSVVVPTSAARPSAQDVIPTSQRPRAFRFQFAGRGPKGTVFAGEQRTFLLKTGPKTGVLFQRVGGSGQRGRPRRGEIRAGRDRGQLRLLYILTPGARIPASLHFRDTAVAEFQRRWPREYRAALFRAIRTAH